MIARSRAHPNPRRFSIDGGDDHNEDGESHSHAHRHHNRESVDLSPSTRRPSEYARHGGRIETIREDRSDAYDDGPAILLHDDDDDEDGGDGEGATERTGLIGGAAGRRSRRASRLSQRSKKSAYGSTGGMEPIARLTRARRPSQEQGTSGNSRSRSKVRFPPRAGGKAGEADESQTSTDDEADAAEGHARGRETDSRPLSRSSSPVASTKPPSVYSARGSGGRYHSRGRSSVGTARMAGDSSGDEGGDVTRGLIQTGGGAVFGGRAGMGMTPAGGAAGGGGTMDVDPAEQLGAEKLELLLTEQGKEARRWCEALRVSPFVGRGDRACD